MYNMCVCVSVKMSELVCQNPQPSKHIQIGSCKVLTSQYFMEMLQTLILYNVTEK